MRKERCASFAGAVVEDVRMFLLDSDSVEEKKCVEGLSYVLHRLVPDEEPVLQVVVAAYNEFALEGTAATPRLNAFVQCLIQNGRPLSFDALVDLKVALKKERAFGKVERIFALIEQAMAHRAPVISRWHADPAADLLGWMEWEDEHVAQSLNVLVEPFWQLRAHEFSQPFGRNVQHLTDVGNSLSVFVVASTLAGCSVSKVREG
jgi:hypothetical protein